MTNFMKIHLFGPFEVFLNGQLLTNQDWRSQQTRAIFKVLLARRGHVVPSDQLIEILWPDHSPDATRRRLHVRISQLRNALGEKKSLVQTVDGGYIFSLDENCWLDVDEFQTAVVEGSRYQEAGQQSEAVDAYEQARQLYRGDFLAEDLYTDWTFVDREFFCERFITLLIELSECYAQQGRYRLAIARCQDALAHDPIRESMYVRLMLYHYYAGERSQSLQVYERCCRVLANEFSIAPLPSTVELAEQIRSGTLWSSRDAPRYPPPIYKGRLFEVPYALSETPFVGRDREYAWLVEQWQNDEKQVIFLQGEAGIGKSRLANEFVGYILSQGTTVLLSRISPGEHSPFAPIISALQPLIHSQIIDKLSPTTLTALSVLFPAITEIESELPAIPTLSPEGERNRLYDAVNNLIAACAPKQTLLLVDDAHRMGTAACEMLARLADSVKILLSYRSEETLPTHPIHQVFRTTKNTPATLQLESLRSSDVQTLISQLANNDFFEIAAEINNQTGGNPLYVVALLQHMFDEGQLYVDTGGGWGMTNIESISLPSTIRETIEARLRRLNRYQRRIFDFAAVLGGEFSFALLQQASQESEEMLLTTLDELIDIALITEPRSMRRSEFVITHDRYTKVAYDTLPGIRRKQIHHQAANAIEVIYADDLGPYYSSLTHHFGKADIAEKECQYAALAGEQAAAQFANAEAIDYLSRALELTPPDEIAQRYRLLLAREKVYDLLGDRQPQKDDLEILALLVDNLDTRQQAEISLRQAAFDWFLGDDVSTRANIEKTISLAHSCQATDLEAASYLLRGKRELDQAIARQDLEMARALAQQDKLRGMEGDIVRCLGNACFWQNSYNESKTYYEEALAIHREVGDLRGELSVLNNLGHLLQNLGNPQDAVDLYKQGLEICRRIGDRLAEGVLLTNLGNMTAELGDYQQAQVWLEQACAIREEVIDEEGVGMVLPLLGNALRMQGKYSAAKIHYERGLAINIRIQQPEQQCGTLDGLSLLHRELGDYASAQAYFERASSVLENEKSPNRVRALANGCLLCHVIGDNPTALEIGEKALALSQELPQVRATALTNLGHVLADSNHFDNADEKYKQALEIRRKLMQSHLATEPLAGLAQLALAQNNSNEALTYIEEILDHLESGPLEGPDQLFQVYLICYRVLSACQDTRSQEILESAHSLLQKRAAMISDDALRQSYLENVSANCKVGKLFLKFQ